jgi:hypothetical protein
LPGIPDAEHAAVSLSSLRLIVALRRLRGCRAPFREARLGSNKRPMIVKGEGCLSDRGELWKPGYGWLSFASRRSMASFNIVTTVALSEILLFIAQLASRSCSTGGMRIWKCTTVSGIEIKPPLQRSDR